MDEPVGKLVEKKVNLYLLPMVEPVVAYKAFL